MNPVPGHPDGVHHEFIIMVCATFLARVNPVSASANPACMNNDEEAGEQVHMRLIDTPGCACEVGDLRSGWACPPPLAVTSAMPPVAVRRDQAGRRRGRGRRRGGPTPRRAGLRACPWANTHPPTASRQRHDQGLPGSSTASFS